MSYFNVRVYGLLCNDRDELLISDELEYGTRFSKFPGGGLELGEGLLDGLKREFLEECNLAVEILAHLYTTDFYEHSSFNDSQLISVYYVVKAIGAYTFEVKDRAFDFSGDAEPQQAFRWLPVDQIKIDDVTFKTDQQALMLFLKNYKK